MPDKHTSDQRSFNMSRIRDRNTKPEMFVRSLLFRLGYRFRVHVKGLPGKPDIVFTKKRKIVFVHGCFWHQHECLTTKAVASNHGYWSAKFKANKDRDAKTVQRLHELGWKTLTVWECSLKQGDIETSLKAFLGEPA